MSTGSKMLIRGTAFGLLLAMAPVASAIGQEASPAQSAAPVLAADEGQDAFAGAVAAELRAEVERQQAEQRETAEIEGRADALRPGEYLWMPERQQSGEVVVVVSIAAQKAYVYRADKLIGVTTVSTGARGHRTPTGSFTILQKNRRHFSNLYNNAPMPNMQRLTWGGIALHAGALPGYPASHGCIRLPMEFSRILFGATQMGGSVHIVAGAPPSPAGALAFATGGGATQMASAR
jgi:lipoprotein-anchoring transpeptidase ErfK/SrfK